jgi:Flp pilus assembly protein TadG
MLTRAAAVSRLRRRFRAFAGDSRAISMVEFAMVAPLMVALYLGCIELSQGFAIDRKLTLSARTMADVTAQINVAKDADVTAAFSAGAMIVGPYSTEPLTMQLSSVWIDSTGKATYVWAKKSTVDSRKAGGAKPWLDDPSRTGKEVLDLPNALKVPSTGLIRAEVTYSYTPLYAYVNKASPYVLEEEMFMRPRNVAQVAYQ